MLAERAPLDAGPRTIDDAGNAYAAELLRAEAPSQAQVRVWVLICLLRMELEE